MAMPYLTDRDRAIVADMGELEQPAVEHRRHVFREDFPPSADHDSSMTMMSLGFVKFPVAFFSISEPWHFVILAAVTFIISFLVEFARVRKSELFFSSKLEGRNNPPLLRRYTPILQNRVRKPSINKSVHREASKCSAQKLIFLKKRKRLRQATEQAKAGGNVAEGTDQQIPPEVGPCLRLFQFLYHFIMNFVHYALMVTAMSNLWILLFICTGGALGFSFGTFFNDRAKAHLYKFCNCQSAEAGKSCSKSEYPVVPQINIQPDSSDEAMPLSDSSEEERRRDSSSSSSPPDNMNLAEADAVGEKPFCH